jgi:hypothetical protein
MDFVSRAVLVFLNDDGSLCVNQSEESNKRKPRLNVELRVIFQNYSSIEGI